MEGVMVSADSRIPIVIDTDPGVDDCIAILLANSIEEFDLRAITAVSGNVDVRWTLRNALFLKERYGLDCVVAKGAEKPLGGRAPHDAGAVHGKEGVGAYRVPEVSCKPDSDRAWDVIYREAVRAEGRLRLIAIGPLTDIAIALEKHPDLPQLVDRLCIMGGGRFGNVPESGNIAEFNIYADPQAAARVFEAFDVHMAGLDVCFKAEFGEAELDDLISLCDDDFLESLFRHMRDAWIENGLAVNIPYDSVGILQACSDPIVSYRKSCADVIADEASPEDGRTVLMPYREGRNVVFEGTEIDKPRLMAMLKKAISKANKAVEAGRGVL